MEDRRRARGKLTYDQAEDLFTPSFALDMYVESSGGVGEIAGKDRLGLVNCQSEEGHWR